MTATILENSGFNRDKKLKIVGTSPVKHDGLDKVTGRKFGDDLFLPACWSARFCAAARPCDHQIDRHLGAERLAGVKAV